MSTALEPNSTTVAKMRSSAALVKRFLEVFEQHCSSCSDYHIANFFRRLHQPLQQRIFDFAPCLALVQRLILTGKHDGIIRIAVYGATDTTLLELVAEAIGQSHQSCDVTVVDRCLTPLLLCEQRAATLEFNVSTLQDDVDTFQDPAGFDIILMHGVLSLLPMPSRTLATARRNLRPGGHVVISHATGPAPPMRVHERRVDQAQRNLRNAVSDLGLLGGVDLPDLSARISNGIRIGEQRPNKITSEADLKTSLASAGLSIASVHTGKEAAIASTRRRGNRILISARLAENDPIPKDADHKRF